MSCKRSSRVLPGKELTIYQIEGSELPCDVELYNLVREYTLKILNFKKFLMNSTKSLGTRKLYTLDCLRVSTKKLNMNFSLLWYLESLDVSTEQGVIDFTNAWEYIIFINPLFDHHVDLHEEQIPPIAVVTPIYYGAVINAPTTSNEVLGLLNSADSVINLLTGDTLSNFVVIVPNDAAKGEVKTIVSIVDNDAMYMDISSNYSAGATIPVMNANGIEYDYLVYELNIAVPYSISHNHVVTSI